MKYNQEPTLAFLLYSVALFAGGYILGALL